MFEAFCKETNSIVKANDILDNSKIFYCCNTDCNAELKVRSIDGKYRANFYSFPNSRGHSPSCDLISKYGYKSKFEHSDIDINIIFNNTTLYHKTDDYNSINSKSQSTIIDRTPRTPKGLLKFSISNAIDTCINKKQNLLLQDIFLDNRNLLSNYKGFDGIKLILCKTKSYNFDENLLFCKLESKNKKISLHIKLYLDKEVLSKLIKYILNKNSNKFSNFPIAILANWSNPNDYHISGRLQSEKHILYDF